MYRERKTVLICLAAIYMYTVQYILYTACILYRLETVKSLVNNPAIVLDRYHSTQGTLLENFPLFY